MKILLLGAEGQLGRALGEVLPKYSLRWGRKELDFQHTERIASAVREARPDVVINAAALTDVDACEANQPLAKTLNADVPGILAQTCKDLDARLVHLSTDYVFGGDMKRDSPYIESDATAPVNWYGVTKRMGEENIQHAGGKFCIVRVCGLYGGMRAKLNYIDQVIAHIRNKEPVRLRFDQVYSPTYVGELAPALWRLIQEGNRGILHLVNTLPVSRLEFTRTILELRGASVPIENNMMEQPTGVPRPRYSALNSERIDLGMYMSDWRTALKKYLTTLPQ